MTDALDNLTRRRPTRLVVGMTGATGAILGVRLLQELRSRAEVETHLVMTRWGRATIQYETGLTAHEVEALADIHYKPDDQGALISSGSFLVDAMVIIPCSMKTLAGIRTGYAEGLLIRAADVTLKERRKLILVPRETPLNEVHLENMLALARMGAVLIPPMPAFYNHPKSVDDVIDDLVCRVLDHLNLETDWARRWAGRGVNAKAPEARKGPALRCPTTT
jgi:flavin prenyltransferase